MGQGQISAFISGAGSDHINRTIHEIWGFTDPQIENTHDFIQWLFPLNEKSRAVPQSPVLKQRIYLPLKAQRLHRQIFESQLYGLRAF